MEEMFTSLVAKRELVHQLMRENRRFSERCCRVVSLRDRMRKWCEELSDDLTIVDYEDVNLATSRQNVEELKELVNKCWRDIEVNLTAVYKDVGWMYQKLNVLQPITDELWWLMAEDIKKRFKRLEDFISRFYNLHVLFQEAVDTYMDVFREENLVIFEKYRHY